MSALAPAIPALPLVRAVEPGPRRFRLAEGRRLLPVALGVALTIVVVAGAVGWSTGWRLHAMTTPSMGTAAPVGSVVISRPSHVRSLRRGQIVVFHPPGRSGVAFAHRIWTITHGRAGVAIRTKGDINPTPDAWILGRDDLIGAQVATIPDLGFLIRALPLLLLGVFVILLATSGLRPSTRGPARNGGFSILTAVLLDVFRPFGRVDLVDEQVIHGRGVATVVPTGILPIRVSARGGSAVDLRPGQVGVVHREHVGLDHAFRVSASIHLTGWWWLALLTLTLPLLAALRQTRRGGFPKLIAAG